MIDRRAFIGTLAGGLLAAPLAAEAQQAGKVYRVGYLSASSRETSEPLLQAFLRRLRELGWVEGENLIFEWRWADGKNERLPALAAELVQRKVDLIVAPTEPAALAAKNATSSVPIVMIFVGDPVGSKLVASLARPGGNVTGTTFTPTLEILGKRLALLKEAVPHASRVAILSNPANPSHARELREVEAAARPLRLQLHRLGARSPEEFDSVFVAMVRERPDGLLVLVDSMFGIHRTRLAELAAKHHLPTMHGIREFVVAGGLMAYGVNVAQFAEGAAFYVDKILKGTKPADLPIGQPTKFELVINLKTAKALGLTIPQSLLLRADEVIQ
ncbi:MAG: transporter substrate-binding protein [Anaerolineales bacterium]|nr:transporter substrate-binding protein [Anaerolineales bacterium]